MIINKDYISHAIKTVGLCGVIAISPTIIRGCYNNYLMKEQQPCEDTFVRTSPKRVAVIDGYNSNMVSINADLISDVSHGYVTSKIIEEGLPNSTIDRINVIEDGKYSPDFMFNNIDTTFTRILDDMKNGKKYDAINISLAMSVGFDKLNKIFDLDLTSENIKEKKELLKSKLKEKKYLNEEIMIEFPFKYAKIGLVIPFIEKAEEIIKRGTPIYIGAGNDGQSYLNLLTLVDGAIVVGALNPQNEKAYYTADNSLINKWENGFLRVAKTNDGYDFTNNGKTDVKFEDTSLPFIKIPYPLGLQGTSYATPRALVKDFKGK